MAAACALAAQSGAFAWQAPLPALQAFQSAAQVSRPSPADLWRDVDERTLAAVAAGRSFLGDRHRSVELDVNGLTAQLALTPLERTLVAASTSIELVLPWPDGSSRTFRVEESPVMDPGLAVQFPELRTYAGRGIDDPTATARFDWTPMGFHAMVLSSEGTVYIDPRNRGDVTQYVSYFRRDYVRADGGPLACGVTATAMAGLFDVRRDTVPPPHGTALRTYRLAVAATGEYSAFFGGTVGGAMNGIVTTMNRVNGLFERDVAVRMTLIANNSSLVFTNGTTDPYTNNNGSTMLGQNQTTIDSIVGSANYDIGHVFSTGGGGVAGLGVVCLTGSKARGVTGSSSPTGDAYDVDYVAHEIGHQFRGRHSFNGTTGNCGGGNRSATTAYEPGSGSTIMGYAGICGAEDLQAHSDAVFHAVSLAEIIAFTTGTGNACAVQTATGNTPPVVSAGSDVSIPRSTPFVLTATGSDGDGDALSYSWEEFDLGAAGPPNDDVAAIRPILRSFLPATSPARTFPKLSDLNNNVATFGESLPTRTRAMTFRVTARDNRLGGGGTNFDDVVVNVDGLSGPFVVTAPNTAVTWPSGSVQTVTWDVAGTSGVPVNTASVNILLSTDGGLTYPTSLSANTPNDGTEPIYVPHQLSTTARVKVEAAGNVYFDISNANFSITAGSTPIAVQNSAFSTGTATGWTLFATPDLSYIQANVTSGVFQFYRVPPPVNTSNQAVIFQETGVAVASGAPLLAQFDLGNTSSVRKRMSVLIIDSDFSDITVCTFWLPANAPLRTYRMQTHTTQAWTNAAIYFYAATAGQDGGYYQVDNVTIQSVPAQSSARTDCLDPLAPPAPGGAAEADLLVNGDFGAGLPPWFSYGTIATQIVAGVLEFTRPDATPPAGVVVQATTQPMAANQILTAAFQLGNSSGVRKRVTVLFHDNDFSDLSACTFWIPPGAALASYTMRTYATKAWTNATVSFYAASVGPEPWTRLDNVIYRRTPGSPIVGTECVEPGG